MLANGTINPHARTFDILGIEETATSIAVANGTIRLAYMSPEGKFVQLVKTLDDDDSIKIGDLVGSSSVLDNGIGGFAQKTNEKHVGTALTTVDWNNTSNLISRTFTDQNGLTRTAVLLPILLKR